MLKLKIERAGAIARPSASQLGSQVEVWRDNEGVVCAVGEKVGEDCWMHLPDLASFRFSSTTGEVTAIAEAVEENLIHDAYHRRVLPMALQVRGREVLHASAVRTTSGVTVFCGVSGSGKSTIAYGLDRRLCHVWADDMVTFETATGGPITVPLPFKIRLREHTADGLAIRTMKPRSLRTDGDTDRLQQSERIAAVCILRKCEELTQPLIVRRFSFTRAFSAVLPHAYFFTFNDAVRKRAMIQNYLELVAAVPVFEISFRAQAEELPALLDVLEAIARGETPS